MKKENYERNIKVTMNEDRGGEIVRTSTTINYGICDYYFGRILYPDEALKAKNDKRYRNPMARYRKWLESVVREWSKTQTTAESRVLEMALLEQIYKSAYNRAILENKNSMGLELN